MTAIEVPKAPGKQPFIVGDVLVQPGDLLAELKEGDIVDVPSASVSVQARDGGSESGERHAELLVLGGGTGGYVAALYAAKMGKAVTLVEREVGLAMANPALRSPIWRS